MFSFRNKIDSNLKYYIDNKIYKKYRVLIECKNLTKEIAKKISSYKGELIYILEYSNIVCAKLDSRSIERISEYPEVKYISFDEYLHLCGMSVSTANKVYFSDKLSLSGKGVGIGLIDSGVYPHSDLLYPSNRIAGFIDLINNFKYPYDDNGHGTCTAGIIASSGLKSDNMYKGIASHSDIYCYKAFDKCGKGYTSTVLYAIESLINISEEKNIKILCLPFELQSHNIFIINAFKVTFDKVIEKGLTPIVPSGSNKNEDSSIMGIATLNNCLTVGGIDSDTSLNPYLYSSSGPYKNVIKPNLCAACVNIISLNSDTSYLSEKDGFKIYPKKLDTSYKSFSGTSIATAYVSGLCALLYEKNPNLTFKDLCSLLKLSCNRGELPKNQVGEGTINIHKLFE